MRKKVTTFVLIGALAAVPALFAQATPKSQTPAGTKSTAGAQPTTGAKKSSTKAVGTHATRGVVKSIDDTTLVITRQGAKGGEMTFSLNASTQREGTIAAGTPVSVRYQTEGKTNTATAITAQPAKGKKEATTPKK